MMQIKHKYGTEFVFGSEIDIDNMEDVECEAHVFFESRSPNAHLSWPPEEDDWVLSHVKLTDVRSDGREVEVMDLDERVVERLIEEAIRHHEEKNVLYKDELEAAREDRT